jgi:alpha-glucosidase
VPIPWEADAPASGFSPTGESWLPQPASWPEYARDAQSGVPGSTLEFYRQALDARREFGLGGNDIEWLSFDDPDVLGFRSGGLTVVANTGAGTVELPAGRIVLASGDLGDGLLPGDMTVWLD